MGYGDTWTARSSNTYEVVGCETCQMCVIECSICDGLSCHSSGCSVCEADLEEFLELVYDAEEKGFKTLGFTAYACP